MPDWIRPSGIVCSCFVLAALVANGSRWAPRALGRRPVAVGKATRREIPARRPPRRGPIWPAPRPAGQGEQPRARAVWTCVGHAVEWARTCGWLGVRGSACAAVRAPRSGVGGVCRNRSGTRYRRSARERGVLPSSRHSPSLCKHAPAGSRSSHAFRAHACAFAGVGHACSSRGAQIRRVHERASLTPTQRNYDEAERDYFGAAGAFSCNVLSVAKSSRS